MICGCAAHRGGLPEPEHLTADAQTLNQVLVPFGVTAFQVFQKATPARNHRQQSTAGMMILAVRLEMILKLLDALAENRYLDFRRADVCLVNAILRYYLLLRIGRQSHARIDTPRLSLIVFVLLQNSTRDLVVHHLIICTADANPLRPESTGDR
jgi:hypothetical protein